MYLCRNGQWAVRNKKNRRDVLCDFCDIPQTELGILPHCFLSCFSFQSFGRRNFGRRSVGSYLSTVGNSDRPRISWHCGIARLFSRTVSTLSPSPGGVGFLSSHLGCDRCRFVEPNVAIRSGPTMYGPSGLAASLFCRNEAIEKLIIVFGVMKKKKTVGLLLVLGSIVYVEHPMNLTSSTKRYNTNRILGYSHPFSILSGGITTASSCVNIKVHINSKGQQKRYLWITDIRVAHPEEVDAETVP